MNLFHLSSDNLKSLLGPASYRLEEWTPENHRNTTRALGKPSKKPLFATVDLVVIIISLTCLVLAYITIIPTIPLAWHLEYPGQIVVIGFLLSIMNVCLRTLSTSAFSLLEARFGQSRLQNYEAVLTGKLLISNVGLLWRMVLIFSTFLPLGLGIAYKRFLHGISINNIPSDPLGEYGIDFPQVGDYYPSNDPIYNLITNLNPFQAAWSSYQPYPDANDFPLAYGYNTLLLSNTSAAILDVPKLAYVMNMQNSMTINESWNVSANVNAYKASYNTSTPTLTRNNTFWNQTFTSSLNLRSGDYALVSMNMWVDGLTRVGAMPFGYGNQMYFGLYNESSGSPWSSDLYYSQDYDDPDIEAFRAAASLYDLERVKCNGEWHINKTSINLIAGHCDFPDKVDQDIPLNEGLYVGAGFVPYQMDTLPVFGHFFTIAAENYNWPWLNATNVVSVATMYWARAVYLTKKYGDGEGKDGSITYPPSAEIIWSSRGTLRASGLLYLVLAIQPLLTILSFIISLLLRDVPIGRGFGITSVLSGFDPSGSRLIDGAALSGELKTPVQLEIIPEIPDHPLNSFDTLSSHDARIRYRLTSGMRPTDRPKLQRTTFYR